MKAVRFYAPEDVRIEDVPEPSCGPDEVKLRVRNCSTCGTDVKILHNGHQNLSPPRTMGHEIAGEVVEVGRDVEGWSEGDRAQVIAAVPCGECYECRRGWMAVCANQTSVGYQYDGGFAEYMIVPRQVLAVDGLNRIPDNIGFDEASVAEPVACAINGHQPCASSPCFFAWSKTRRSSPAPTVRSSSTAAGSRRASSAGRSAPSPASTPWPAAPGWG